MDSQKEINCRRVIELLVKTYGWAHTLSALEFHLADTPMGGQEQRSMYDVLNAFDLSVLIEQRADVEGVTSEIGWLVEIREEEINELVKG